jgi:hypothetical protein
VASEAQPPDSIDFKYRSYFLVIPKDMEGNRPTRSWLVLPIGSILGAGGGILIATWVGKLLSGGLDLGGPIWTVALVLSLVFGSLAGALVGDFLRKRPK